MNQSLIDETIAELYRMHGVDLTSDYAAKIRKILTRKMDEEMIAGLYGDSLRIIERALTCDTDFSKQAPTDMQFAAAKCSPYIRG